MNRDFQDLLCSCSSGCIWSSNTDEHPRNCYNCFDVGHSTCESDREEKQLDDWEELKDESWDVISALRQKLCKLSKSEAQSTSVRESPRTSCTYTNRQSFESRSVVERASDSIDYTPESEFLRRIKQQCQYLQNRLPNIFTTLNDCFPENEVNECQKCLLLKSKAQHSNGRSWKCCSQQPDLPYRDKKMRMKPSSIFQRPSSRKESCPPERLKANERKSDHISRPKKRNRGRRFKKRRSKNSPDCLSENEFEASLKKPNENSCERCWRFASPARSPVNKPDQRYDPNFRRGHSTTTIKGEGEGDVDYCTESDSPDQRNTFEDMDRESPCARRTCDTSNRSPANGSQPYATSHISIKQKMEAAWDSGPKECSKHLSPPASQSPNECPHFSSPNQRGCSQKRSSVKQIPSPSRMQHLCSKHMGSSQQPEPSKLRSNIKCPVHEPECPEQRYFRQRSPQQVSPQYRSSQHVCSPSRSPQPTVSQQKCLKQTSLHTEHTCKQSFPELSRGFLSSCPKAQSQRTQNCSRGSKGRSPCGIEDLDVTEYKDICTSKKTENYPPCPDPCSRGENIKKTPPCGAFNKTSKPCECSKMETIPENTSKDTSSYTTKGTTSDTTKDTAKGTASDTAKDTMKDTTKDTAKDTTKDGTRRSSTPGLDRQSKDSKKNKSTADSGKGNKKDNGRRKIPDKGKSVVKSRGRGSDGGGKRVTIGGASTCGAKKPSQFDKAHPIRHCRCPPRMPESESPESYKTQGQTVCCHCDWDEENHFQPITQKEASRNGSQGCDCNTPRQVGSSRECLSPILKAGTMECPYRAYVNKFGPGGVPSNRRDQEEDSRQFGREGNCEISTQELLECTPRKYFMFYMTQERNRKDNNLDVLVEELAQGCPKSEAASRTKDIKEKMKKLNEPHPDSMALRFQKGVTEGCNVPQSSRMLYF